MRFASTSVLLAAVAAASSARAADLGTVFVIAMENHNWTQPSTDTSAPGQIKGNAAAPYINSLITPGNPNAAQVSYASNYLNAANGEHPSEPNYVWAEAGTNYNAETNFTINNDNDPTDANKNVFHNTNHLTAQMNAAGVSWKNYQEDYQITNSSTPTGGNVLVSKSGTSTSVTNPYYNTNQYNYAAKHDPMAFFSDTATQNVATFDSLRSDIAANTVSVSNPTATNNFGQYNWITPNQYNDMHSSLAGGFTYNGTHFTGDQSAIATGDNFLSILIPQLMATEAYKNNGAIVIWMDETEGSNRDDTNHTLMEIVISPLAKGNAYVSTIEYNHSSDIKTMEEIFQLGGTLNNALPPTEAYLGLTSNTVAGANDLSDLFLPGTIPTAVPEPASLGLLSLGGLLLLKRRR
jgi:hypothetical protein